MVLPLVTMVSGTMAGYRAWTWASNTLSSAPSASKIAQSRAHFFQVEDEPEWYKENYPRIRVGRAVPLLCADCAQAEINARMSE